MTFSELGLHKQLLKAVETQGFETPTQVQTETIPIALEGKDLITCAKTGSGKTAAFILPLLHGFLLENKPNTGTRGLILLPTRELALQTQRAFEQLAAFTQIKSGLIIGGEPFKYQVANIRKNPEVIIATPGRLVEHIEKGNMDFNDLEVLVLDEADRMLDMGFAEEMETIVNACQDNRQTLLYSATLHHKGMGKVKSYLRSPQYFEIDPFREGQAHITQQIVLADDDQHKEKLTVALIEAEAAERVFVFCKTRAQAQKVSNILKSKKVRSEYIHGEVSQSERKQVLNRFRQGHIQVLVATDVAARGLDIPEIDLVINFTVAHSGDDHVHRVGRTGRAGKEGIAVTLVSAADWNLMSSIERYLKIRFEPRKIKGFEAKYSGPKKLKSSGKAAGTKKKKTDGRKGKLSAKGKSKQKGDSKKAPTKKVSAKKAPVKGSGSQKHEQRKRKFGADTTSTLGGDGSPKFTPKKF